MPVRRAPASITSSSTRPAAAKAIPLPGWRTSFRCCTTPRTSASLIRWWSSPTGAFWTDSCRPRCASLSKPWALSKPSPRTHSSSNTPSKRVKTSSSPPCKNSRSFQSRSAACRASIMPSSLMRPTPRSRARPPATSAPCWLPAAWKKPKSKIPPRLKMTSKTAS